VDDLQKFVEKEALGIVEKKRTEPSSAHTVVDSLIHNEVKKTDKVNSAIDLMFTHDALRDQSIFDTALKEKKEELRNNAEAKRIEAETSRISKEVDRVKQEKAKGLALFDKIIEDKKKEVEELKAESDKAQAFFDSNEDILSYIGVKKKKTLKIMYMLMVPAVIVFALVQTLALPITISGKLLELIIGIVSDVCKQITNNALKISISIIVILVIMSVVFLAYYFGGKLIL
jgi:hypothetical protein